MELQEFKHGMRVAYIPNHVGLMALLSTSAGYPYPKDVQLGVVSSINEQWVFVKFDNGVQQMVTGDEPYTAQACHPRHLVLLDDYPFLQS